MNTLGVPFNKTMRIFHFLHPFVEVDFTSFVDDFHLKINVILDQKAFISTLVCSPLLSFDHPLGMVYELL
jgi:hypothetical protein